MKKEYVDIVIKGKFFPEYFLYVSKIAEGVEGTFVEAGFGEGLSANIFANIMESGFVTKRNMWLYDSFEGFPEPSPEDKSIKNVQKGEWKVPIEPALKVQDKIDRQVNVVKGYFEDTIPNSYTGGQIAILHLDCDLYSSYKVCLEGLYDKVAPGGVILFDEYKSAKQLQFFPGASKAIDSFFKDIDIQMFRANYDPSIYKSPKQKFFTIKPS